MKRNLSFIKSLAVLSAIITVLGCENFTSGGNLALEMEDQISKANATEITARVLVDEGYGTVYPAGDIAFKVGYEKELTFEASSSVTFQKWFAFTIVKDGEVEKEVPFYDIEIADPFSSKTTVKITKETKEQIRIKPKCVENPAVSSTYPQYPKDSAVAVSTTITVGFITPTGTNIESESFFFTTKEQEDLLNQYSDIVFLKNSAEKVYGYVAGRETHFKNIEILSNNYSILDYYSAPVLKGNVLSIPVNPDKPITFDAVDYKDITVNIGAGVFIELDNGARLNIGDKSANSWNYRVSKSAVAQESADITFAITENAGKVTPSVVEKHCVGDTIDLSCTPNDEFKFIKWLSDTDSVSFADSTEIKTTATLLSTDDDTITAYCVPYLNVTSVEPNGAEASYEKDSSIVLKFNRELSDENDLSAITVYVGSKKVTYADDSTGSGEFLKPVKNGNVVTISSNPSHPIDVTSGTTKQIKISVPASLYYLIDEEGLSDEDKRIEMLGKADYSYNIDERTSDYAVITFTTSNSQNAAIAPSGTGTYYHNQVINLSASMGEGYMFAGWKVTAAGKTYSYDGTSSNKSLSIKNYKDEESLVIADATSVSTIVTVKNAVSGVVISPIYEAIPSVSLKYADNATAKGKIYSTAGNSCIVGKTFTLSFTESQEYVFKRWQIKVNGITQSEENAKKYVDIDFENSDTDVKILKAPTSGSIQFSTICNSRPKFISYTPSYTDTGVYRDSRIKIMFDSSMAIESFFWTEQELIDIGVEGSLYTLKKSTSKTGPNGEDLYYSYMFNNDPSTITYRNISITERTSKENLLCHYAEPFFTDSENKVFVIPSATAGTGGTSVDAFSEVVVNISSGVMDSKKVCVSEGVKWAYYVNSDTDATSPSLSITSLETQNQPKSVGMTSLGDKITSHANVLTDYGNFKRTDGVFRISSVITDAESRPKSLIFSMKKYASDWYSKTSEIFEKEIILTPDTTGKAELTDYTIDLSNLFSGDGIYELSAVAYDNNGNSSDKYVYEYVVYDNTPPSLPTCISFARNKGVDVIWNFENHDSDLASAEIVMKYQSGVKYTPTSQYSVDEIDNANCKISVSYNGLSNSYYYRSYVTVTDLFGNITESAELNREYAGCIAGMYYYKAADGDTARYSKHYYPDMKNRLTGIVAKVTGNYNNTGILISTAELNGKKTKENFVNDFKTVNVYDSLDVSTFKTGVTYAEAVAWATGENSPFGNSSYLPKDTSFSIDKGAVNNAITAINDEANFPKLSTLDVIIGVDTFKVEEYVKTYTMNIWYWTTENSTYRIVSGDNRTKSTGHNKINLEGKSAVDKTATFDVWGVVAVDGNVKTNGTKHYEIKNEYGYARAFCDFTME